MSRFGNSKCQNRITVKSKGPTGYFETRLCVASFAKLAEAAAVPFHRFFLFSGFSGLVSISSVTLHPYKGLSFRLLAAQ